MKNALLITLLVTFMTQVNASVVIDVKCTSPELNYLNRFTLEQSFEAWQSDEDENVWKIYSATLKPVLRKAGNSSQNVEAALKVSGTLTKVESQMTKEPYYSLKLQSRDKKVLAYLNLDYPSNLSSRIRSQEGRLYKAKCKLQGLKSCLFGDSLYDILESEDFTKTEAGEESKVIPGFDSDDQGVNTKKVILTHKSGKTFTAWYTFQDEVDGGNTYGVIENKDGTLAATIGDGDIYDCAASL